MKSLKIQYGVPKASKIKNAVNEIEEAIEDLNYDAIDIEIGIALNQSSNSMKKKRITYDKDLVEYGRFGK